jgi:hypothetical protein
VIEERLREDRKDEDRLIQDLEEWLGRQDGQARNQDEPTA